MALYIIVNYWTCGTVVDKFTFLGNKSISQSTEFKVCEIYLIA
jgi:hypothetical protein